MTQPATREALYLVECLDLPAATGVDDARWEAFQLVLLNDLSPLSIDSKSRQIAWSWTAAARSVARAILDERSSIFVSINLDEAKEKIRYARSILEALDSPFRLPRLARDNELGLEFFSGARILSFPGKAPRGKARFDVYLDEFAHVARDRMIYQGSLPIISKGGQLRIGSSPMGASGLFWEILSESLRKYPGFRRGRIPWWETHAFCRNPAAARQLAPAMTTAERVEMFGKDTIQVIHANMPLEDFQQEYECEFVDEASAWIPWEEIRANQDPDLACTLATCRGRTTHQALEAITWLRDLIGEGQAEPALGAGVDIGRTRNTTELYVGGLTTTGAYPLRLAVTLDGVPFDEQYQVLAFALRTLPISKMLIDRGGLGMQLAEDLARAAPAKAEGVDFTAATKTLWATTTKMLFQQRKTPIPADRDLAYQIHSIKRTVTPSKNFVFDTERSEKHHADKFWALALMYAAQRAPTLDYGRI